MNIQGPNLQYYSRYIPIRNLTRILLLVILIGAVVYFITSQISKSDETEIKEFHKTQTKYDYLVHNDQKAKAASKGPSKKPREIYKEKVASQQSRVELNPNVIKFGRCQGQVILAVVLCGDRQKQTLVTLKSAVALSTTTLHLVIMADEDNQVQISEEILDWPSSVLLRLSFEVHPITFPENHLASEWKKLFKPCAAQRLFLPSVLPHIDALLYVDTDVLFLRPPDDVWAFFSRMNSSQMAALSPEHEDFATGWYNRFARHPFYQPLGVNSGVMLMNLTKLRKFQWDSYLEPIFQQYKQQIVWGDQDIINIIFHYHSDKLYIYGCEWNYRPDHCMYSSVCKSADPRGICILHGNRGTFANGKQPSFRAVYQSFDSYLLGSNLRRHLLSPLKDALKSTTNTNCGRNYQIFYRQLEYSIARLENQSYPMCSKKKTWVK